MLNFLTKKKNQRGFTLIELLVVIAIIGILSGIVIVAVGDATARARDSRRLADVRQLAFILEKHNALEGAANLGGCTGAHASTTACYITDHPAIASYFDAIVEPAPADPATICGVAGAAGCAYSISKDGGAPGNPTTNNYQICFWLETDVPGPLGIGLNSIRTGARLVAGCP